MLSNHTLQKSVVNIGKLTGEEIFVFSPEGKLVACSEEASKDSNIPGLMEFFRSQAESQTAMGYQFIKVFDEGRVEYIVVSRDTEHAQMAGKITALQVGELSNAYRDKLDKDAFFKNLLLDNMLLVDIYSRAKKLHIDMEEKRVVVLIRLPKDHDMDEIGRIKDSIQLKPRDFITAVDEDSIVIITALDSEQTEADIEKRAQVFVDSLSDSIKKQVRISYGNKAEDIKSVSRSYKEAIMAMEVGEIFFKDRQVVAYSLLGIGRLVYQLPIPLCKMFIKEIFKDKRPDDFDEEMLSTINKFFENSLNVSETSRQLYIHRNTLVYRLDKLQKSTGLDLRVFEDAITFKIAMMVVEYMKFTEEER